MVEIAERVNIRAHQQCLDRAHVGDPVTVSTSEFIFCEFCGTQADIDAPIRNYTISGQLIYYEFCDCDGRIRHNNGGNYHEKRFRLISRI